MQLGNDDSRRSAKAWTKSAARILAAGTLAATMTALPLVEPPASFADGKPGDVTINVPAASQSEGHTTNANDAQKVRYNAYRVFSGDVGLDTGENGAKEVGKNKIANVSWASGPMHSAVVGFIQSWDAGYADPSDSSESALKAAEFIANHIGANGEPSFGAPNQDPALKLGSGQFGSGLVAAIRNAGTIDPTPARNGGTSEMEPGKTYSLDDGWYLFVTSTASVNGTTDSRSGTSPIFAVVGGEAVTVTEKASVPTVQKRVKDDSKTGDSEEDWGLAADAHARQDVRYRLVGTVADNIASYDTYYYRFTDKLDGGLAFNAKSGKGRDNGDARVFLHKGHDRDDKSAAVGDHGLEVTDNFKFSVTDGGVMTAETENLRALSVSGSSGPAYEMVAGDFLTMEYTARLVPDGKGSSKEQGTGHGSNVVQGSNGNVNGAKVTYSNNPKTDSRGSSYTKDTRVYTYSLRLHKQDKQNAARALRGAKFTLQVAQGDDAASTGKYVQADGSLAAEPHEFSTDSGGNILVKNLDVGTYTLSETAAPPAEQASGNPSDSYELLDPATIVIGSNVHSATGVDGRGYSSGNIYRKETGLQALEVSATASAPNGTGHGSLIDLADGIDASGSKAGEGLHVTPAAAPGSGAQGADGNVSVVVREAKETQMPLTGGAGLAAFAVVGAVSVAAGAAALTRRRIRKAESRES